MSCNCSRQACSMACHCQNRSLTANGVGVGSIAHALMDHSARHYESAPFGSVASIYHHSRYRPIGRPIAASALAYPNTSPLGVACSNSVSMNAERSEVRVSQSNWIEQILANIRENRDIEIVFDDPNVVSAAIEEIRRRIPPPFNFFAQQLEQEAYSADPAARALVDPVITPTVVIAIIAAVVVIGLALIIGIIMLFNTAMARDISQEAMKRGYNLCDVRPGGRGQGSGDSFNFVNDSRWVIRKNC